MRARFERILLVDDNRAIHEDYRKILAPGAAEQELAAAEAVLFDQVQSPRPEFDLTSAFQGEQAIELIQQSRADGTPFALAFLDVRMPPGIDGVETARRLWEIDPDLQIVICSAYSDYSWDEIAARLGTAERWVILKKPFDNIEVLQLAIAFTEKWRLRREIRASVAELEQRVGSRTAELEAALQRLRREAAERARAEEERRAIERKLEEAQRLEGLGVLAGGIAHDFNNILTGILMSASLARMEAGAGGELQQHLRRIEDNSRRAAGLCEQMLAYAGKGRVEFRALALDTLVRETLELLQVTLPKDAELRVELDAAAATVRGDPARLRQVLMNLVTNAAEALREPPRRLRLLSGLASLDRAALARIAHPGDAQPGEFAFIEVSDTGVGMSAETLRRIFEPFFTTKFTGRGLGLCAVLGIMRSHGGALDVASVPGRGTTFRAYFPVQAATVPAAKPVSRPSQRGGGRVLVIDDEESVRAVAVATLARHGFDPVGVPHGEAALELVARGERDFAGALVDLTMPGMDGAATVRALRHFMPALPAVMMTGFSAGDLDQRMSGIGGVQVVQKPFTIESLLAAAAVFSRRDEQALAAAVE